jgi:Na+-translocating ferredoxin:NAD+ oxidoreductase RnfD subunit
MRFQDGHFSPYSAGRNSVGQVMRRVLYAMVAGIAALVLVFWLGRVGQSVLATGIALLAETAMLAVRGKPLACIWAIPAQSSPPGCWRWRCRRWRRGG